VPLIKRGGPRWLCACNFCASYPRFSYLRQIATDLYIAPCSALLTFWPSMIAVVRLAAATPAHRLVRGRGRRQPRTTATASKGNG
jgi:hypothetical protein